MHLTNSASRFILTLNDRKHAFMFSTSNNRGLFAFFMRYHVPQHVSYADAYVSFLAVVLRRLIVCCTHRSARMPSLLIRSSTICTFISGETSVVSYHVMYIKYGRPPLFLFFCCTCIYMYIVFFVCILARVLALHAWML
jgi:hypothetical protein